MKWKGKEINPDMFMKILGEGFKGLIVDMLDDEYDWVILLSSKKGGCTHQISNQAAKNYKAMAAWLREHADCIETGAVIGETIGPMQ